MGGREGLLGRFPRSGRVEWIGVRSARRIPVGRRSEATAQASARPLGDRYETDGDSREPSLIHAEHLPVVAALMGLNGLDPVLPRRNPVVSALNLLALKGLRPWIGDGVWVLREGTPP